MTPAPKSKGPFFHRVLVCFLSTLLSILFVWLLGFVVNDIGKWEGPNYPEIESRTILPADEESLKALEEESAKIFDQIADQKESQDLLRDSATNSQTTMTQLLGVYRLSLEKDIEPTPQAQAALAENQKSFLLSQNRYQSAIARITELKENQRDLARRIKDKEAELAEKRKPARAEYQEELRTHQLKVAAAKLSFLVPLFLIAAVLVFQKKKSDYRSIFLAGLISTSWKVGMVMHDYFPSEIFKYVLIGVGILVVLASLVKLIRLVTAPALDWMLKQYREAYQKHRCPICSDPIQRGPFRHAVWKRKGPTAISSSSRGKDEEGEKPYVCPSCGTGLFEECTTCGSSRHALLPFCDSCGTEKEIAPVQP